MSASVFLHGASHGGWCWRDVARLLRAAGHDANAGFLARAAADADFVAGRIDTGLIERHADRLVPVAEPRPPVLRAAAHALLRAMPDDPWAGLIGFRANVAPERRVELEVANVAYLVEMDQGDAPARIAGTGSERVLFFEGEAWPFGPPVADRAGGGGGTSDGALLAPMPGRVIAVDVAQGQAVAKGQRLLVLEAMKMEQALLAPFNVTVEALDAAVDAQASEGALLARIVRESE